MLRKGKRFLALFLAVLMFIAVIPEEVLAEEIGNSFAEESFEKELDTGIEGSSENEEDVDKDSSNINVSEKDTEKADDEKQNIMEMEKADTNEEISESTVVIENEMLTESPNTMALSVWDGTVAESFSGGDGTENNPYLISTAAELAYWNRYKECQGKYFELTQDIVINNDLEDPIYVWEGRSSFDGNLNGNGHTIYNMYIWEHFIRTFSGTGYIQNLVFENIKSAIGQVSITDYNYGTIQNCSIKGNVIAKDSFNGFSRYNMGVIRNCEASAEITVDSEDNEAEGFGIVCFNEGTIQNCTFSGHLTAESYVYGIARGSNGIVTECNITKNAILTGNIVAGIGTGAEISNCNNYGTLNAKERAFGISDHRRSRIINCENAGSIIVSGDVADDTFVRACGIADQAEYIYNCRNSGAIICEKGAVAGIVCEVAKVIEKCSNTGNLRGYDVAGIAIKDDSYYNDIIVKECYNKGNLDGVNTVAGIISEVNAEIGYTHSIVNCFNEGMLNGEKAAGIVLLAESENYDGKSGYCIISNCYNKGEIIITGKMVPDSFYVTFAFDSGGIVGLLDKGSVENCYNIGLISCLLEDTNPVGGIAGRVAGRVGSCCGDYSENVVKQCYNNGAIIGNSNNTGGVVGCMESGTILGCFNSGEISTSTIYGTGGCGGVAGSISLPDIYLEEDETLVADVLIKDSYNSGDVKRNDGHAGGIVGLIDADKNKVNIENCYNVGKISGYNAEYIYGYGEILGVGWISDAEIIVKSCYGIEGRYRLFGYGVTESNFVLSKVTSASALQTQSTFDSSWDFENVWEMGNEDYPYPVLRGIGSGSVGDKEMYQKYVIRVLDEESRLPLKNAQISIDGTCYGTFKDGTTNILMSQNASTQAVISKNGYKTRKEKLSLDSTKVNDVYLEKEIEVNMEFPEIKQDVKLENSVNLAGQDFKWLDWKFKIDLDLNEEKNDISKKFPISIKYDGEKGTYKIVGGVKQTDKEGNVNTDSYEKVKKLYTWIESEREGYGIQEMMEDFGWSKEDELGIKIDTHIMCFLEVKIDEDGKYVPVECGALIGFAGKGEVKYRPAFGAGILYATMSLELSAEGQLTMEFENNQICYSMALELGQALGVAVGAGAEVIHVEGGAEGELKEKISYVPQNKEIGLEIDISAKVYLEGKFFCFELKPEVELFDVNLVSWNNKKKEVETAAKTSFFNSNGYSLGEMELMERDYLEMSLYSRRIAGIEQDSVYPDGAPEMVQLKNGTLLAVWITDNGTKSAANRTTLVYSVNEGGGWSIPKAVCETGRADAYPSLSVDENTAYLSWLNIDHVLADNVTVEELAESTDVYFAVFENGSFSDSILVSESGNKKLELCAQAVSDGKEQTVIWLENSENDPFLSSGTNSIYARTCINGEWGEVRCLVENLNYVTSLQAEYIEHELNMAYAMDLDGSQETKEDIEVFLFCSGVTTRVTSDKKADSNVRFYDNVLYWSSDGEIMKMKDGLLRTVASTGLKDVDAFEVLSNGNQKVIMILRADGFKNELYASKETEDGFSEVVPLTDMGQKIRDYAAVYQSSGDITAILFVTEVLENVEETTGTYGNTHMLLTDKLAAANLVLNNIDYDMSAVKAGTILPLKLNLYNGSSDEIKQVKVILRKSNETIKEETLDCSIHAGENGSLNVSYTLPEQMSLHKITAEVYPVEFQDTNLDDNVKDFTVGFGDVMLKNTDVMLQEDGSAVLTGSIANIGYGDVSDISLRLLEGGEKGAELYSATYSELAAGAEELFSCTIPESALPFSDENDRKHFYLKCVSGSEESQYDNNSETLVVSPTKVTGIEMEQETMELPVKSQGNLVAAVVPETAMNTDIYYTTNNSKIATVDEMGTITATGVGEAVITAITADGGYAKSCKVTVNEAEEGKVLYELSEKALLLEKGTTGQLSVVDGEGNISGETVNWTSSDESIAAVDANGLVTAFSAGTVQIIANISTVFYDTCVVEVVDKELQAILFGESSLSLLEGENTVLSVNYIPANTVTNKTLDWKSSDESVAVVDKNGVVTAVAKGTAVLTAASVNGRTAECKMTVEALPRYTVSFDSDLGETPTEIGGILNGQTIQLPTQPVKTGYYFNGWYTEKSGQGTRFTAYTPITENMTVYAYWTYGQKYEEYTVEDIPVQTYTGLAVKPKPVVLDGGTLLVEGQDYTVSYKNNIKAGTGQVIVRGKGNYTKTMTIEFEIEPKDINDTDISAICADKLYNGKEQLSKPVVKWGPRILKNGTDYTVTYSEERASAGEVTVYITGKGNYTGLTETSYRITDKDISKAIIEKIPSRNYTGEKIEPEVFLYADKNAQKDGKPLEEGIDYEVSYENNVAVGKGKIIITGKNTYGGSRIVTFSITKKDINSEKIEMVFVGSETKKEFGVIYNGKAQMPKLTVSDNGRVLEEGTDYQLSYSNHTKAATVDAKVKPMVAVKGIGNYTGSAKLYFNIWPQELTEENELFVIADDAQYTGKERKPNVKVFVGGRALKNGRDYRILYYGNNVECGEKGEVDAPYVRIEGMGNYCGEVYTEFRIYQASAAGFVVDKIASQVYTPNGAIEPEICVYESTVEQKIGNALTKDVDYEITAYENNEGAGTAKAVITGLGKYGGSKTVTFKIEKRSLEEEGICVEIKEDTMTYTGRALKPAICVKDGEEELSEGVDFTVSYSNNTNVPKTSKSLPTITIKGKGNYSGTRKETFEIKPKDISESNITALAKDILFSQKKAESKTGITTTLIVMDENRKLNSSSYQIIGYQNNRALGEITDEEAPTVLIAGTGNYTGRKEVTFRIYEEDISKATVEKLPNEFYTGKEIEPKPTVKFKVSKTETITLEEGKDYILSWEKNAKIGKAKVVINGVGKYGGSKTVTFMIMPKWLKWF